MAGVKCRAGRTGADVMTGWYQNIIVFGTALSKPKPPGLLVGQTHVRQSANNRKVVAKVYEVDTLPSLGMDSLSPVSYDVYVRQTKVGSIELTEKKKGLYIEQMDSFKKDKYKGVGTAMHQLAVETSLLQGLKGKVSLYSLREAVGFHYKCGFRTGDTETDRLIHQAIQEAKDNNSPEDVRWGRSVNMHLPPKNIARWKKIIRELPILNALHKANPKRKSA